MKTLKELFKEKRKSNGITYGFNELTATEAVKEWLTQKRQEGAIGLIAKEAQRNYNMVIEELLEELQEE